MSFTYVSKKSHLNHYHYCLADNISKYRELAMRLCSHCFFNEHKYKMSETSDYCDFCIQSDVLCNLTVLPTEFS